MTTGTSTVGANLLGCALNGRTLAGFACQEHGLQFVLELNGTIDERLRRPSDLEPVDVLYTDAMCPECGVQTHGPAQNGAYMDGDALMIYQVPSEAIDDLFNAAARMFYQ